VWVEVTTLVIPNQNDAPEELRAIARFLVSVSPDVPWHVSGFHPTYRMTAEPPTPASALARARALGREEGLRYVYAGNRPGSGGEDTLCPGCGALLLQRRGFSVLRNALSPGGACPGCGAAIPGVDLAAG
jgi:pyruvate formate lyase activating enzyme